MFVAKNYKNLIILPQVTIENVGDVFWDTVYNPHGTLSLTVNTFCLQFLKHFHFFASFLLLDNASKKFPKKLCKCPNSQPYVPHT